MMSDSFNLLHADAYLEQGFNWGKKFVVLFSDRVSVEEDYVELLIMRLLDFFEAGFSYEQRVLQVRFLTEESRSYDSD